MVVKTQLENGENEFVQVAACKSFIEKFFSTSDKYAFNKEYTVFDVHMQIKNYFIVCTELGINKQFANMKEISVDTVVKAFEELGFTGDRNGIFFKFNYIGPLVFNPCLNKHQMPVGREQWRKFFQQLKEC